MSYRNTDNKKTNDFINELKSLFIKYNVSLFVYDKYGGNELYLGQEVEIKSLDYKKNRLPICITDMDELSKVL